MFETYEIHRVTIEEYWISTRGPLEVDLFFIKLGREKKFKQIKELKLKLKQNSVTLVYSQNVHLGWTEFAGHILY